MAFNDEAVDLRRMTRGQIVRHPEPRLDAVKMRGLDNTHIEAVRDGLDQVISVRFDPSIAASVVEQTQGGGTAHSSDTDDSLELEPAGAA